jgi:hypothetical protein
VRLAVAAAIAFLIGWPLYDRAYRRAGDQPVPWSDLTAAVGPLALERPAMRVFRDPESLAGFHPRLGPVVDFARYDAVLVSPGPRSSTAYRLVVRSVVEERARVIVTVEELAPTLLRRGRPRVTSPYRLIAIPAGDKPVEIALRS